MAPLRDRVGSSFSSAHSTLNIRDGVSACHRYGRLVVEHSDSADSHHKTRCGAYSQLGGNKHDSKHKDGAVRRCKCKQCVGVQQCALLFHDYSFVRLCCIVTV
jgi:hypothetical protein